MGYHYCLPLIHCLGQTRYASLACNPVTSADLMATMALMYCRNLNAHDKCGRKAISTSQVHTLLHNTKVKYIAVYFICNLIALLNQSHFYALHT